MYLYRFPGIRAGLSLAAAAGLAAGTAAAQPNLVPVLNNPMSASVGVQNTGASAAGPSQLTTNCTSFGQPNGGCPAAPVLAAYSHPASPHPVVVACTARPPGPSSNTHIAFRPDSGHAPGRD